MTARRWPLWILVLIWGGAIFTFSGASFSSAHTSGFFSPLFQKFLPGASPETLLLLNYLIRKSAHLAEYFILGWLLLIAVRAPARGWKLRWALVALLIAAGYSATDEWHQSFVPDRNPSPWDSLLDTTGAAAGIAATWIAFRRQP